VSQNILLLYELYVAELIFVLRKIYLRVNKYKSIDGRITNSLLV